MLKYALAGALAILLTACGGAAAPASSPSAASGAPAKPVASAAASTPAKPASSNTPATLKVWDSSTTVGAPLYIAMDRGYLKDEGIEVEPVQINGAFDAQVPPLSTGQLDVGGGTIIPALFNSVGRGLPVRVTAIAAMHTPGRSQLIVARKDLVESGQLKSYADLKGKVLARPAPLGIATIAFEKALEQGGLKSSDVTYLDIPTPDTVTALANKKADVAYMTEPFATQSIEKGFAVKWHEMADLVPNHVAAQWAYGSKLISGPPDVGQRFMVALMRGMRDYEDAFRKNKDRAAIVSILVKHTTIKDPALYDKMQ
ncbi:MAG TPA: ABC transporter substrate-binding protein, partial [Chloroflexota bacterium]|nr:ABC transporter substrate-binding protein [Chloroflexota bacterium]